MLVPGRWINHLTSVLISWDLTFFPPRVKVRILIPLGLSKCLSYSLTFFWVPEYAMLSPHRCLCVTGVSFIHFLQSFTWLVPSCRSLSLILNVIFLERHVLTFLTYLQPPRNRSLSIPSSCCTLFTDPGLTGSPWDPQHLTWGCAKWAFYQGMRQRSVSPSARDASVFHTQKHTGALGSLQLNFEIQGSLPVGCLGALEFAVQRHFHTLIRDLLVWA